MKNEINAEFQYLKIPYGEDVLVLLGSEWIREYGADQNGHASDKIHFHNLMEIGICRQGAGEMIIDDKRYLYKKDDVAVIPRNFSHTIISNSGEKSFWEYIYVQPAEFLENIYKIERKRESFLEKIENRAFIKSRKEVSSLASEINLIMDQFRVREYEYQSCTKGLMYALLMEIVKINHKDYHKPEFNQKAIPRKVNVLAKALEYIEEDYTKDLHVSDIAQAAMVSETYLRRLFAECCTVTPMQYVKLNRIEAACRLLKNKDVNINEVAFKVGYTNITTFINNFKQITGMTPKQWKQSCNKN